MSGEGMLTLFHRLAADSPIFSMSAFMGTGRKEGGEAAGSGAGARALEEEEGAMGALR